MNDIISHLMKVNNAYEAESRKETELFELRQKLNRDYSISLDYESDAKIDGIPQELNVIATKDEYVKKIKSRPNDSFKVGGIVDCYNEKWLITAVDPNIQIIHSGEMTMCNYTINFLDEQNNVSSCPCVIENYTKYNSGIKSVGSINHMDVGTVQLHIQMPYNSQTKIFDRTYKQGVLKGKAQRVLLDYDVSEPKVFEVTLSDRINRRGLLLLTLTESSDLSEDDNVDNMIANYYSRINSLSDFSRVEIEYYGNPVLYVGGEYKQFRAIFKSSSGELISDETAIWNVALANETLSQYLDVIIDENIIRLKVKDSSLVGVPIELQVSDSLNSISAQIILDVIYNA